MDEQTKQAPESEVRVMTAEQVQKMTSELINAVNTWENVMVVGAQTEADKQNMVDTAIQMRKLVDIIESAKVREMKALAVMILNAVFYGSGFIEDLLYVFTLLTQGKELIEKPTSEILNAPVGNA